MIEPPPSALGEPAESFLRAFLHAARNAMQQSQTALSLLRLECSEQAALIDEAERGGAALTQLFECARRFASPIEVRPRRLDVCALVARVFGEVGAPDRGAALFVDPPSVWWEADPALLGEAFRELVANALEAKPEALQLSVRMREAGRGGRAVLEIVVEDNGPGLTKTASERAFEPFWSTRAGAVGLGLPRARKACEAQGGRLELGEPEDDGTTFLVTIPRLSASRG